MTAIKIAGRACKRVLLEGMLKRPSLADALAMVRTSADHIVLDRLVYRAQYHAPDGTPTQRAVYLDTETTGCESDDQIIELGLVAFDFDPATGRIFGVEPFQIYETSESRRSVRMPDRASAGTPR